MELIERAGFLTTLQNKCKDVAAGDGHCILLSGEAGMGKTSLVKAFCKTVKDDCKIYQGTCDAMFTPRPLAPLYDIALQMQSDFWKETAGTTDKASLFTTCFEELANHKEMVLIIFEDVHWADEATLDFIKFLARRITHLRCLFILTYRNDEVNARHPLRNVLGQLPVDSFTRLQLAPLSRKAVEKLAGEKGYSGEDVYGISGGNPFYVNEILASYSTGIPDNIKDAILSVYRRQDEKTKEVWQLLSVLPTGLETAYLEQLEPLYASAIEDAIESKILLLREGVIFFKHELYRRTIEASLSPFVRIALNKNILAVLLQHGSLNIAEERIIHHAKNANEYDIVVEYAPVAALKAAGMGAHIEASKLYYTAIEYYQGKDKEKLIHLYEAYAYECYLTNQLKNAIIYQVKSLTIWKEKNNLEKAGNCMRSLSRLWWFEGNMKHAESYGRQAIEVFSKQPSSPAKAMAYSNMSQLKMLSENTVECIFWGEQAIAMAKESGDNEIHCHALNNVGAVKMGITSLHKKGTAQLQESLQIALQNSYHEHAARAYTNLSSKSLEMKVYPFAKKMLDEGIAYCEARDLDSWTKYMSASKSRFNLEMGHWNEAFKIADALLQNEQLPAVVKIGALAVAATIKLRRGNQDALSLLLEAKSKAFETMELQRIIPVLAAALEYEWLTGTVIIENAAVEAAVSMALQIDNMYENSKFGYWLLKARKQSLSLKEFYEGYHMPDPAAAIKAAAVWEQLGCPYEQALALFEGGDAHKRQAITIVQELGAVAVCEKMKQEMRGDGIKSIPRGIRKTTSSNAAHLTQRELDVLVLLKQGLQNKEIAATLFISAKTVDHHISAILFKLDVNTRVKAVQEAISLAIIK